MPQSRAFDADLRDLVEREGPFSSIYLNTEATTEEAPHEIEIRWRDSRRELARAGAPAQALEAVDALVKGAHQKGDGLVAVAQGESIALRRFLSSRVPDHARFGPLPLLLPYLEWQQDNPRYAVVLSDRTGGEIHVIGGLEPEEDVEVEGRTSPIKKVKPGGWSQRRYQQRAENTWEANAKDVAHRLEELVRSPENVAFVVIAGDVRAVAFIREHLGKDIESVAFELKVEPNSIDEIRNDIEATAAAYVGRTLEQLIDKFQEERGQHDLAADGLEATFDALRKATVDTLLIVREGPDRPAWFVVSDVSQAATDKGPLTDLGIGTVDEANATDVLTAAALKTGSRVVVIPELPAGQAPRDGVGALLRYA
jgi:peptide subunit release factor 1 (eRF1)